MLQTAAYLFKGIKLYQGRSTGQRSTVFTSGDQKLNILMTKTSADVCFVKTDNDQPSALIYFFQAEFNALTERKLQKLLEEKGIAKENKKNRVNFNHKKTEIYGCNHGKRPKMDAANWICNIQASTEISTSHDCFNGKAKNETEKYKEISKESFQKLNFQSKWKR